MNGDGNATTTLSQTFNTVVGHPICGHLSALNADPWEQRFAKQHQQRAHVVLGATGNQPQTFADPTVSNANGVFPYIGEEYFFVATSTSSTITFTSIQTGRT